MTGKGGGCLDVMETPGLKSSVRSQKHLLSRGCMGWGGLKLSWPRCLGQELVSKV